MSFTTHEDYFATLPSDIRARLEQIQGEVEARVPGVSRCIGYKMPAFKQQRMFFYFAAFKNHIGIYPPVTDDPDLIKEISRFRGPKGNLSFPLKEPLPLALIGRIAVALSAQYAKGTTDTTIT